ncbi:hypothetical protein L2750_14905 [Shewanella submarina]|uniref:Uncharacterized protein n=1 Tax=Shewanella submarina TaxID=2016376 RepID=A0ABV7G8R9_9GAMM|nr:hypothetical protein [Shewanella submarina]MCL1038420.1 hypothetical protein [Shewanella submarina]
MLTELKVELTKFDWSGVSGVSDVFMVFLSLLLLRGLRHGAKSLKESSLSRDADILRWAMAEMDDLKPKIRVLTDAHKRHRYCDCSGNHVELYVCNWDENELRAAQDVSVKLQRIGYMALHNLISRNHFMNIWGPMFLSTWYALEPWVKHKRIELEEPQLISQGAYSRMYLEQYAKYCEVHLPLQLVNNERKRFGLLLLTEKDRSKFDGIKLKIGRIERLNIGRQFLSER